MPYFISAMAGATPIAFGTPMEDSQFRYNGDYRTMLIQACNESITFDFIAITGGTLIGTFTIDLPAQTAVSKPAYASATPAEPNSEPVMPTAMDYFIWRFPVRQHLRNRCRNSDAIAWRFCAGRTTARDNPRATNKNDQLI